MPHKKATPYDNNECFTLPKKLDDDKKINPKNVFKGYTPPKGQNRSNRSKGKKESKGDY